MTIDLNSIMQAVMVASLIGIGTDHFRMRAEIARMWAQFVTRERLDKLEAKMDHNFEGLSAQLMQVAKDLEFLRGRSQGA